MKKILSIALVLAVVLCLSAAAFAAETYTVTLINGMDGSVYATYTVADGEDFVFTISCAPPADMGPVAAGEAGSGVVTTVGSITYSNITLGGPNQYPTAETVTVSGIDADAVVTVTPNPAEVDSQFPEIFEGEVAVGGGSGEASSGEPSGEASSDEPSGEPVVPGTYTDGTYTLVIDDDMTFSMDKTGQNIEGEEFVLTVRGTVTADGVFTVTGLFDGDLDLIEVASEEQIAEDLATVEAVYAAATASGEPSGEPSGEGSGEASSEEPAPSAEIRTQPATDEEYEAYEAYLREFMTAYDGVGDGSFDEGARSMAIGELDGVGFGADVTQFPFEMYINAFGAMSFAEWIAQ